MNNTRANTHDSLLVGYGGSFIAMWNSSSAWRPAVLLKQLRQDVVCNVLAIAFTPNCVTIVVSVKEVHLQILNIDDKVKQSSHPPFWMLANHNT